MEMEGWRLGQLPESELLRLVVACRGEFELVSGTADEAKPGSLLDRHLGERLGPAELALEMLGTAFGRLFGPAKMIQEVHDQHFGREAAPLLLPAPLPGQQAVLWR